MALTNFGLLTNEQKTIWSMELWKNARNLSFINNFLGKSQNSMIQHITELKKSEKGARAVITLLADLEGDGVAGDRTLEGNEDTQKTFDQVIQIDQLRNAERHEGRMADQKSIVEFRNNARDGLAYWLADRMDQMAFLTLAGISYANHNNGQPRIGSDLVNLDFAADVTAPSNARRLRWDDANQTLVVGAASSTVLVADTPSWNMIVALKAYAKNNFIRGIRGEGGRETYNLFLTPTAMRHLKLDPDYNLNLRHSAQVAKNNPLFSGEGVTVDGINIFEFRHVPNTSQAASGSKYGAGGTIEGAQLLFCGAQALGLADIGAPIWNEKGFDYDNQQAISVGKIFGLKKPQFGSVLDLNATEDFGVISCYVSTPL